MSKALVLGGTKGLGRALALECAAHDIVPIVTGRSVAPGSFRNDAIGINLDLTDKNSFTELEEYFSKERIDYFFWVAGIFDRGPFGKTTEKQMSAMIATHLSGPLCLIRSFHSIQKHPYRLVVIASTSSWRLRDEETLYCSLKAAKAAFTRNFANELFKERPGSKVTLVNPGGMQTPDFWDGTEQDISQFMKPEAVASLIWDEMSRQQSDFKEIQIIRGSGGRPILEEGPRMPELPK